jgi:hypothetical protein
VSVIRDIAGVNYPTQARASSVGGIGSHTRSRADFAHRAVEALKPTLSPKEVWKIMRFFFGHDEGCKIKEKDFLPAFKLPLPVFTGFTKRGNRL